MGIKIMDIKKLFYTSLPYIFILLLMLTINACSNNDGQSNLIQSDNIGMLAKVAVAKNPLAKNGTLKSIKNAGGYSYLEVDIKGETFWLATAIINLKPGEEIAWKDFAVMKNFNSKSLNRVFEQILFVDRVLAVSALGRTQHQGVVLKAMDSAGYSYIHVEEKGKKIWLAAPSSSLQTGQTIRWYSGAAMRNFSSKTLKRTFDEIYFVNSVKYNL